MAKHSFKDYEKLYGGYKNFPEFTFYTTGGLTNEYTVKAPDASMARQFANGETNSWVKIGKVKSVKGEVKRFPRTSNSSSNRKKNGGSTSSKS